MRRPGLVAAALALAAAPAAQGAEAPFAARFAANAPGDIAMAANTLATCTDPGAACAAARAAVPGGDNNNALQMAAVDVDGDPATASSSRAGLVLPAGAEVLFAGLYAGTDAPPGTPDAALTVLRVTTPGGGGPQAVAARLVGRLDAAGVRGQAFADVTALVRAGGAGAYTVGGPPVRAGSDAYGGWALVVAYRDPSSPLRNLTVFDGFRQVQNGSPVTIPLAGFVTPATGPVRARLGVVSYEGDRGTGGDGLSLGGRPVGDAANPADNVFNATIGVPGARTPLQGNQLGFDADVLDVSGLLANGATATTVGLTSSGDVYYPGVVTAAIDLFAPELGLTLAGADLDGGALLPGDVVEYEARATSTGGDAATGVTLTLAPPPGTTAEPGFPLSVALGTLAPGATGVARFRVRVGDGADGDLVATVSAAFAGQTLGVAAGAQASAPALAVRRPAPAARPAAQEAARPPAPAPAAVAVTLSGGRALRPGLLTPLRVRVRNTGGLPGRDVLVRVVLPAGVVAAPGAGGRAAARDGRMRTSDGALVARIPVLAAGEERALGVLVTARATARNGRVRLRAFAGGPGAAPGRSDLGVRISGAGCTPDQLRRAFRRQ